ncbi:hypothetical protein V2G26_006455 [Clonostachys chloroleuca]
MQARRPMIRRSRHIFHYTCASERNREAERGNERGCGRSSLGSPTIAGDDHHLGISISIILGDRVKIVRYKREKEAEGGFLWEKWFGQAPTNIPSKREQDRGSGKNGHHLPVKGIIPTTSSPAPMSQWSPGTGLRAAWHLNTLSYLAVYGGKLNFWRLGGYQGKREENVRCIQGLCGTEHGNRDEMWLQQLYTPRTINKNIALVPTLACYPAAVL